jgi:hypothetical protein
MSCVTHPYPTQLAQFAAMEGKGSGLRSCKEWGVTAAEEEVQAGATIPRAAARVGCLVASPCSPLARAHSWHVALPLLGKGTGGGLRIFAGRFGI